MRARKGEILAWHFLPNDYRLQFEPRTKISPGSVTAADCKPILCQQGLHASIRLIDALEYSPGNILCRVAVSGEIIKSDDKLVGTIRRVLWMLDADWYLHEFACQVAEQCLKDRGVTDERSWNAIQTKRDWLAGYAGDKERAAAWNEARAAARAAAWNEAWTAAAHAARDEARAAARAAAWNASWAAARDEARAAAWNAARGPAWTAARAAQNKLLARLISSARWERE